MTVPTEGERVIGASSGKTNSNDVGPTGAISPSKIRLMYQISVSIELRLMLRPVS